MNVYEKIKIKFPFNPHTAYFIPLKGLHSLVIQLTKNNMLQLAMRKKISTSVLHILYIRKTFSIYVIFPSVTNLKK